ADRGDDCRNARTAYCSNPRFFFQAEDGIRDGHVTGVQTCALPISKKMLKATNILPNFVSHSLVSQNPSASLSVGSKRYFRPIVSYTRRSATLVSSEARAR